MMLPAQLYGPLDVGPGGDILAVVPLLPTAPAAVDAQAAMDALRFAASVAGIPVLSVEALTAMEQLTVADGLTAALPGLFEFGAPLFGRQGASNAAAVTAAYAGGGLVSNRARRPAARAEAALWCPAVAACGW
jgi:hypothetical protein